MNENPNLVRCSKLRRKILTLKNRRQTVEKKFKMIQVLNNGFCSSLLLLLSLNVVVVGIFQASSATAAFLPSSLSSPPRREYYNHQQEQQSSEFYGFCKKPCLQRSGHRHAFKLSSNSNDNDDDIENMMDNTETGGEGAKKRRNRGGKGPEKSRMKNFIDRYVAKNREEQENNSDIDDGGEKQQQQQQDDEDDDDFDVETFIDDLSTHLIAIPMDSSHELLLELESVQRAILYHCPILTDSCIPGSMTRLPLLYVKSNQNSQYVTSVLTDLVQELIQNHLLYSSSSFSDGEEGGDEEEYFDPEELNSDGYKPVTVTFQSLEIDGTNNNVLNTVGMEDDFGTKKLCNFVDELQQTIEDTYGWKTSFPFDPHNTLASDGTKKSFRPRIPFMELPRKFDSNLSKLKNTETEISDEDMEYLTSDQGGNGISPIFWCQWWDDVFGRNIRLREIGIYPRTQRNSLGLVGGDGSDDDGLSYTSFYLPYEIVPLPEGNPGMVKNEQKFQKYQDQRMTEEQEQLYNNINNKEGSSGKEGKVLSSQQQSSNKTNQKPYEEPDILMTKTRNRLEKIYIESDAERAQLLDDDEGTEAIQGSNGKADVLDNDEDGDGDIVFKPITASPDDYMDDWMKQRIQNAVGDEKQREEEEEEEEDKEEEASTTAQLDGVKDEDANMNNADVQESPSPSSSDYYMDEWMKQRIQGMVGSLESVKSRNPQEKKEKPPIEDNPVFKAYKEGTLVPKDQKVAGKKKKELGPYPSREHFVGIWKVITSPTGFPAEEPSEERSENLILRIDGTTAGGPVLDPETNQKAAGGTWKMIDNGNGNVDLRIRLVIPPKKERVIEMMGNVERLSADLSGIPMASKAFGIPHLEAMAAKAMESDSMEEVMHCSGEVSIEDAITKKNREQIGTFSLMKLQGPLDRSQYTITIPKPIRSQD